MRFLVLLKCVPDVRPVWSPHSTLSAITKHGGRYKLQRPISTIDVYNLIEDRDGAESGSPNMVRVYGSKLLDVTKFVRSYDRSGKLKGVEGGGEWEQTETYGLHLKAGGFEWHVTERTEENDFDTDLGLHGACLNRQGHFLARDQTS